MKTLIILAHPNLAQSTVNRRWLAELEKHPDRYTVHKLYDTYPDGKIDVAREQALVEAHDNLVFQFPVYWFNCPPLLKHWLDEVLTYGWAYGSKGKALENRKTGIAVSLGAPAEDYRADGAVGYGLAEVLRPFELTARYCHADWQPAFAFHTIDSNAGYDAAAEQLVAQSAADYLAHLEKYFG
ncbi:NAD(P)H-dependent oxidoreductase [Eikenella sp. S3360]|uniref:NAD(P)H-dependent oxidoreductase n=1 Tax=Eikenella glucosivorans TaxID=2766967 RepID=A0ABS0N7E4_9NEIS|nr:NAD(P)H-dependent oxidoreductase [Eikenella glucosivorans]MBH5328228.1 NAD(P)H-dependent oxidoreductase [Eikenella glucosivorans]